MASGIASEVEQLSQHKGIAPEIILEAIKDAMLAAARKYYKSDEELVAELNPATGAVSVFAVKTVTDLVANPSLEVSLTRAQHLDPTAELGDEIRFPLSTSMLGRIAAQQAKQVILQKVREAERQTICREFEGRVGTMEYCTVKRHEGPDMIVEIAGTEARLPRRDQSRLEAFAPGERVRVIIRSVEPVGRGPAVIVSRSSEELVRRLFEQEVPEIYDSTVEIVACAREAGERTKIAVRSRDRNVDAVGACVGMRGMRVQAIIRELRGEKIDIIQYLDDPLEMVRWGVSPAKVTRVNVVDPELRHMEVIVDETQLSLAIGKKGQNVRLAAKLLGWRIDIKSEDQNRREVQEAIAAMSSGGTPTAILQAYGLSPGLIARLAESGAATLEALADMTPEQLLRIESVGPELVDRIRTAVNRCYTRLARTAGAVRPAEAIVDREEPEELDLDSEPKGSEPVVPPVLPGEPDSEAAVDDDDDELEFDMAELDSFGKMNVYRGPDEGVGFPAGDGRGLAPAEGTLEALETSEEGRSPEALGETAPEGKNDSDK
ncbi:MAG: transcription termination factor NusA [Bryobacterales bacterium]|nr:transcription termination factor NusA [Bryobacterales bacterium]